MERLLSLATPTATITRLKAFKRYLATRPATTTLPQGAAHSIAIRPAGITSRSALALLFPTPTAAAMWPSAPPPLRHTLSAAPTRRWELLLFWLTMAQAITQVSARA